jgi:hypothetical protein
MPADLARLAAGRGIVLLASDRELLHVREGADHPVSQTLPSGIAPVRALAVERRRDPRLAVAGARTIAVLDSLDASRMIALRMGAAQSPVEDVAWGPRPGGGSALYLMQEDGSLERAHPDTGDTDEIPLHHLVAMAAGEDGAIAVASIDPAGPAVWTTRDGETWHYRTLDELDGVGGWHLAVSGDAVALGIAWRGVWVSRGLDEPFARCDALGEGGPVVFAGDDAHAPLLCAVHEGTTETILRVDAGGAAARIAAMDTPPGIEEPHIASLAWDAASGAVWGLLAEGGLLRVEPGPPSGAACFSS